MFWDVYLKSRNPAAPSNDNMLMKNKSNYHNQHCEVFLKTTNNPSHANGGHILRTIYWWTTYTKYIDTARKERTRTTGKSLSLPQDCIVSYLSIWIRKPVPFPLHGDDSITDDPTRIDYFYRYVHDTKGKTKDSNLKMVPYSALC